MSSKLVFIRTDDNDWCDINRLYDVGIDGDMIYNIIAIIFLIIFVLSMKHEKTAKQMILLFKNDFFKILYLSLLLFIDIKKYPLVMLMLVCIFFYITFFINTKENMENISFVEKNIFEK